MSNYWTELNTYEAPAANYGLIPNGTLAKVRMNIKPGGYNDPAQGWTGGYAAKSNKETISLNVEFVVLEGQYMKRKIWGKIGLFSNNGPDWGNMGKAFIKGIINSAYGLSQKDTSDSAIEKRKLESFAPLQGIEFIARIDITKDKNGNERNEIRAAITPDHKEYAAVMGNIATANHQHHSVQPNNHNINNNNRPTWA